MLDHDYIYVVSVVISCASFDLMGQIFAQSNKILKSKRKEREIFIFEDK